MKSSWDATPHEAMKQATANYMAVRSENIQKRTKYSTTDILLNLSAKS